MEKQASYTWNHLKRLVDYGGCTPTYARGVLGAASYLSSAVAAHENKDTRQEAKMVAAAMITLLGVADYENIDVKEEAPRLRQMDTADNNAYIVLAELCHAERDNGERIAQALAYLSGWLFFYCGIRDARTAIHGVLTKWIANKDEQNNNNNNQTD